MLKKPQENKKQKRFFIQNKRQSNGKRKWTQICLWALHKKVIALHWNMTIIKENIKGEIIKVLLDFAWERASWFAVF